MVRTKDRLTKINGANAVKAGFFYTLASFLEKSMAFITTPIFTSILTKSEYAAFSSFASWQATLLSVFSLQVYQSVNRAKFDYSGRLDEYISSVVPIHVVATALGYILFLCNQEFFTRLTNLDSACLSIMFVYLFSVPAYHMLLARERAMFRYRFVTVLTTGVVLLGTGLALLFVYSSPDNRLIGRIVGQYSPLIITGIASMTALLIKGKRVDFSCWKYALVICLPLTVHYLGMQLIISINKMLLPMYAAAEEVALFSLGTNCSQIAYVLIVSINNAWTPWMMEKLQAGKDKEIRRSTTIGIGLFLYAMIGVMLVAPEIVLIMGGRAYISSVPLLPPLIAGCMLRFIVSQFVSIELYDKCVWKTGITTMLATIINIGLFLLLVPKFGYMSASYISLASVMALFALHYSLLYRIGRANLYNPLALITIITISLAAMFGGLALYNINWLRYTVIGVYALVLLLGAIRYRKELRLLIKKR